MSEYPTLDQVEAANAIELLRWHRFLPSPGLTPPSQALTVEDYEELSRQQAAILRRIKERLDALGGISPEISKAVGWGEA